MHGVVGREDKKGPALTLKPHRKRLRGQQGLTGSDARGSRRFVEGGRQSAALGRTHTWWWRARLSGWQVGSLAI